LTSGTGTLSCVKIGTGPVINYGSGTGTRHKIMYLISFIKKFFHSHFTINLLKFMNFFLVKQLNSKKSKNFQTFLKKNLLLYGLDMELEPEPEP
jgi:hypothetical protein